MEATPQSKRFNLGPDKEIRSRIHLVQESVLEMKKERPEIVSLATFGSMVKGYATPESDIDGRLIVNVDSPELVIEPNFRAEIFWNSSASSVFSAKGELPACSIGARFDPKTKEAYEVWAKKKISEKIPGLKPEQTEHIGALPISIEVLDTILNIWKKNMLEFAAIKEAEGKVRRKHKDISDIMLGSIMREKGFKMPKEMIAASEYISHLFFLDIGGGLKPYRSHIIKKLFSFGQIGHEMWTRVIGFTEVMERKVNDMTEEQIEKSVFTNVRYPRTLMEAKKIYG